MLKPKLKMTRKFSKSMAIDEKDELLGDDRYDAEPPILDDSLSPKGKGSKVYKPPHWRQSIDSSPSYGLI